jgi:hypothetical protein
VKLTVSDTVTALVTGEPSMTIILIRMVYAPNAVKGKKPFVIHHLKPRKNTFILQTLTKHKAIGYPMAIATIYNAPVLVSGEIKYGRDYQTA